VGEWVNVKTDYCAIGDGVVDDFGHVQSAVTAAASDGKTVYFPKGPYKLGDGTTTNALTIGGTRLIELTPGAVLKPQANTTITINCPLRAAQSAIFDLSGGGTIVLGGEGPDPVLPDWWGVKGDDTNNDALEIKQASDAATGKTLYFPPGVYRVGPETGLASPLRFDGNRVLEFAPGARIKPLSNLVVVINCPIRAERYQIFDTSIGGIIRFGPDGPGTVYPEWWGAKSDASANASPAIQQAINAVTDSTYGARGGEVLFSAGEYQILDTITLPRGLNTPKLVLRGVDLYSTALAAPSGYPTSGPVLQWNPTATDKWVSYQVIRDLQISRSTAGPVIQHTMIGGDQLNSRLFACKLENLLLGSGASTGTDATLDIEGALSTSFRDVGVLGNSIGFRLKNSSHVEVSNFRTEIDRSLANGIVIEGGGNHVFVQTRIEGVDGGSGVRLDQGTKNILFCGLFFEGKLTNPQIDIRDASVITVINAALGSVAADNIVGIKIGGSAKAIRLVEVYTTDFTTFPKAGGGQYAGCVALKVETGARYISVDGFNVASPWGSEGNARANIVIQTGTRGIDIRARDETSNTEINKIVRVTSDPPTFAAQSTTPSVAEGAVFKTANTSATTITNLLDGYSGQEVTIIFTDSLTTIQSNANFKLASTFVSTPNDTLKLVYDGALWRELSRSVL
jgi:hypothetical protein